MLLLYSNTGRCMASIWLSSPEHRNKTMACPCFYVEKMIYLLGAAGLTVSDSEHQISLF